MELGAANREYTLYRDDNYVHFHLYEVIIKIVLFKAFFLCVVAMFNVLVDELFFDYVQTSEF